MPDPTPVRGSSTVLSIREHSIAQRIVLHDPHGDLLARPPCELVRVADGELHEVDYAYRQREQPGCVQLTALRRRHAAPPLAVGDVVRWDLSPEEPNRRFVHASALWWFFMAAHDVVQMGAELPEYIAQRLDDAPDWARLPWYDAGRVDPAPKFEHSMLALFRPLLWRKNEEPRAATAGAAYLEAARRVLLTIDDVRQRRVPVYHRRILMMIERWDPLARLGNKDRDDARPVARALEALVLQAALIGPPGLRSGQMDASLHA